MLKNYTTLYFGPDTDGTSGGSTGGQQSQTDQQPDQKPGSQQQQGGQSYEDWFKAQPKEVQQMIEGNTTGLKSALQSERTQRQSLEKQVRDLASKAEAGSQTQQELTKLADTLQESDRRADFYAQAHEAGVTNLKLAYMVAVSDELFDRKGNPDFAALRQHYPELFGRVKGGSQTRGDEGKGDGSQQNNRAAGGMNDFIRASTGRRP